MNGLPIIAKTALDWQVSTCKCSFLGKGKDYWAFGGFIILFI